MEWKEQIKECKKRIQELEDDIVDLSELVIFTDLDNKDSKCKKERILDSVQKYKNEKKEKRYRITETQQEVFVEFIYFCNEIVLNVYSDRNKIVRLLEKSIHYHPVDGNPYDYAKSCLEEDLDFVVIRHVGLGDRFFTNKSWR